LLLGALFLKLSYPLAVFIMLGFFSMTIVRAMQLQIRQVRIDALRDAYLEQHQLAEQVRNGWR
jgi:hypothetical protein